MRVNRVLLPVVALLLLVSAPAAEADGFEYSFTPYLWASGLDGSIGLGVGDEGGIVVDVDASFSDIMDNLDVAIPLHFEAKAPVWTLIAEVNFVSLSQELGEIDGTADTDALIVELLAGWQWTETVEILFGSRYYDYEFDLEVPEAVSPLRNVGGSQEWVDPVVGIRYGGQLNRRGTWHSTFRADVAGFGLGSDLTWNVRLNLAYDFNPTVRLGAGYHWLDVDYDDEGLVASFLQQGPEIGLSFRW